ncbi:hypothetical protein [Rheinheimera maricola]|uniref:Uncharacterized protein n=1 Tax=Rheinheimera maricola TaxID=2793282 RepID=A0ABS7X3Y8_9GAMM|nr:hypothetical protein [Rheinheimera maricola]MBZ9610271.1 hypothetical protein [Rheinheimera maricola]
MNRPEQTEQKLQQQYQHDKACHVLPAHVRRAVLKQAAGRQRKNWHGLWRNTQLALSCAFMLVLGYLLLQVTPEAQWYYQIALSEDAQYRQVQHHGVTDQPGVLRVNGKDSASSAYQQYLASEQRDKAFYAQTGLLQQQADQWQISVCNELLLTIDKQLLHHLQLSADLGAVERQWVEFISDPAGQLVAIRPVSDAVQCPQS